MYILILIITAGAYAADDGTTFCKMLAARASVDAKTLLAEQTPEKQMDELMEFMAAVGGLDELAAEAIDKKMSWSAFKAFAKTRGAKVHEAFRPRYDGRYLNKHCGTIETNGKVTIINGKTTSITDPTYSRTPNPVEHSYYKELKGSR